jgi:hypothetical protein
MLSLNQRKWKSLMLQNLSFTELFQMCAMEIDGQPFLWLRLLIIQGHDFYGCGHADAVLAAFN